MATNSTLIIASAIAHGRAGFELAARYLSDLRSPVAKEAAPMWNALRAIGDETDGPISLPLLLARDPELDTELWHPLVSESETSLEQLERWLDSYRRWHCRQRNAERLEALSAKYRAGEAQLDTLEIAMSGLTDGTLAAPSTSTAGLVKRMRVAYSPETKVPAPVPTGFDPIDEKLGGGPASGELVVIAGRPGCGKSQLVVAICRNGTWAQGARFAPGRAVPIRAQHLREDPVHTLFISLEMTEAELTGRILADLCDIDVKQLRKNRTETLTRYRPSITAVFDAWEAADAFSIIDFTAPELAGGQIDAIVRTITGFVRSKREAHGPQVPLLVIIDYLSEIQIPASESVPTTKERFDAVVAKLKRVPQREKIPLILLAQLNRESAKLDGASRAKKRPRLDHLKESGRIEEAASTVLFVDHEYANQPGVELPEEYTLEVIVAKGRNVGLGAVIPLHWTTRRARLTSRAEVEKAANDGQAWVDAT